MSLDLDNLPLHVAITMDGNGRWATLQNKPRTFGHDAGLHVAKDIVKAASDIGLKNLTLYIFSTENWKRAKEEVSFLMNLIHIHLKGELQFYIDNNIRLNHIGDVSDLPANIQKELQESIEATKDYTGLTLNMAINYGGRNEIIRGIKKIVSEGVDVNNMTEQDFSKYLDMPSSPDVDLLIRTGGEQRLSNFLLWHIPYAEQVYTDTLWPDYKKEEFYQHLEDYQHRNRRFGAEKPSKKSRGGK